MKQKRVLLLLSSKSCLEGFYFSMLLYILHFFVNYYYFFFFFVLLSSSLELIFFSRCLSNSFHERRDTPNFLNRTRSTEYKIFFFFFLICCTKKILLKVNHTCAPSKGNYIRKGLTLYPPFLLSKTMALKTPYLKFAHFWNSLF